MFRTAVFPCLDRSSDDKRRSEVSSFCSRTGLCGGLSFYCFLFPTPPEPRLPPPPPHPRAVLSPARAGNPACPSFCQRGPSYHCSRSDIASQDFSSQDAYLERNSPQVLLTHTLVPLPGSQGSGSTRRPPAICGPSPGTAAEVAGEPGPPHR